MADVGVNYKTAEMYLSCNLKRLDSRFRGNDKLRR